VLQGIRSSLLRLRLEAAMKLAMADFRIKALCFLYKTK